MAATLLATTIFEEAIELCSELAYEALSAPAVALDPKPPVAVFSVPVAPAELRTCPSACTSSSVPKAPTNINAITAEL